MQPRFDEGARVTVLITSGINSSQWLPGVITRYNKDDTWNVYLDAGREESRVFCSRINIDPANFLPVGARAEVNWQRQGKWYPVVIQAMNGDGTYKVHYSDGSDEHRAKRADIRLVQQPLVIRPTAAIDSSVATDEWQVAADHSLDGAVLSVQVSIESFFDQVGC